MILRKAMIFAQALTTRTRHALMLMPRLAKKPAVLRRWLLSAHWAQVAMLLVILVMSGFIPSAVDAQLEKLYPPTTTKKMFGLIKHTDPDPRLESRKKLARVVLWVGSGCLMLYLFVLHVPRAIGHSTSLARKRENEADALAESKPSASVLLYNTALSLATDPEYEAALREKVRTVDERLSKTDIFQDVIIARVEAEKETPRTIVLGRDSARCSDEVAPKSEPTNGIIEPLTDGVGPEGRYYIKQEVGRGGMGIVYRAHDDVLARDVALKRIPDYLSHDQELMVRLRQEARALARLSHPNIVQVYDFVQDGEQAWIAMEFVEGEELGKSLQEGGPLPIGNTVRLGIQMAKALAYAHGRGVIHRDFKPANVLLTRQGLPKITDFGVAKLAQSDFHTREGSMMGSPAYMSPEQAAGKDADPRSDIYSLGVTLYKMLTGQLPFEGDVESIIAQKLTVDPAFLPKLNGQIPEQLRLLVSQMLAKEPDNRPASMDAVAGTLKAVSNAQGISSEKKDSESVHLQRKLV